MSWLGNAIKSVGDAIGKGAQKVGSTLKAVAPVALSVVGKANIPLVSSAAGLMGSLLNPTNTKAPAPQVQAAKQNFTGENIGIFQNSGVAVKTIGGKVSIPVNGNGVGIFQSLVPMVTATTSGHVVNQAGVVQTTLPVKQSLVSTAAADGANLPVSDPLKKIQEIVNVINDQQPQAPTNAPSSSSSSSIPQWVMYVLYATGGIAVLWILAQLFKSLKGKS